METSQITSIVAKILYLEGADRVDPSKSLFKDYGMSSLDFVDFAFEVRAASAKEFQPDQLWPVNAMMTNREYFAGGDWTDAGREELGKIFADRLPATLSTENLYQLFSVAFVEDRLRAL